MDPIPQQRGEVTFNPQILLRDLQQKVDVRNYRLFPHKGIDLQDKLPHVKDGRSVVLDREGMKIQRMWGLPQDKSLANRKNVLIVVGRDSQAHVILDSQARAFSNLHVGFVVDYDQNGLPDRNTIKVVDFGSTNGTQINSSEIDQPEPGKEPPKIAYASGVVNGGNGRYFVQGGLITTKGSSASFELIAVNTTDGVLDASNKTLSMIVVAWEQALKPADVSIIDAVKQLERRLEPVVQFGKGKVQKEAIERHKEVQDAVSVCDGACAVADGVTNAGLGSARTAREIAGFSASKLPEILRECEGSYRKAYYQLSQIFKQHTATYRGLKYDQFGDRPPLATFISASIYEGNLVTWGFGDCDAIICRDGKPYHIDDVVSKDGKHLHKGIFLNSQEAYGPEIQAEKENTPYSFGADIEGDVTRMTVSTLNLGDRIIITSDGLKKILTDTEIYQIVSASKTPVEAEEHLIETALAKNNGIPVDDYGVVVVFYGS